MNGNGCGMVVMMSWTEHPEEKGGEGGGDRCI